MSVEPVTPEPPDGETPSGPPSTDPSQYGSDAGGDVHSEDGTGGRTDTNAPRPPVPGQHNPSAQEGGRSGNPQAEAAKDAGASEGGGPASGPDEQAVFDEHDTGTDYGRARITRRLGYVGMFSTGDSTMVGRDQFNALGDVIINNHHGTEPGRAAPATARLRVSELSLIRRVHVATDSDQMLLDRVRTLQGGGAGPGLTLLRGLRDTGRVHSALAMLAIAMGVPPSVADSQALSHVTVLSSTTSLEHLAHGLAYDRGHGYVVDATGAAWVRTADPAVVAALRERVCEASASLVVVIDEHAPSPTWGDDVLQHRAPDCAQVLSAHVAEGLLQSRSDADPEAVMAEVERFPSVREHRARLRHPWDAAVLAAAVVAWERARRERREGGPEAPAEPQVQVYRRRELLGRARELLRLTDPAEAPRAQAFVIAGAVLDGESLSDVIIAAHLLSDRLAARQDAENPPPRVVFGEPLQRWLHHVEVADASPGSAEGVVLTQSSAARTAPRTRQVVRLREPTIAGAVLEVVWGEYDEARDPLLGWLMELCSWRDETVRVRAALAIGRLATMDFELVERAVLTPWAASSKVWAHRAAAWALEGIVVDGATADKALALLRRWSQEGSVTRRAVAIRAYGTRIGALHCEQALQGIRSAFTSDRLDRVVNLALVEIYAAGEHEAILTELGRWSGASLRHRETAAACFMELVNLRRAAVPGGDADTTTPDLLDRVRKDPRLQQEVARLWAGALEFRATQHRGWRLLQIWRNAGRSDPVAAEIVRQVEARLRRHPTLRQRLTFYDNVWRSAAGGSPAMS